MSALRLTLACALALAAAGCGSEHRVDLGRNDTPGVIGASLMDYVGSWEGYAEAFQWGDSTDQIRLRIDEQGHGVLEVGSEQSSAPVSSGGLEGPPKPVPGGLAPGFDYSVSDATVTARRIRLSASSQELYADWCSAFEPIADANNPGRFACLPNTGWSYEPAEGCRLMDAARTPFDCAKANCEKLCQCDADSCAAHEQSSDVRIDAALSNEGEELTGTLVADNQRIVIRMQRIP